MTKVSVATLEKWGRERLSKSFFLRDFLFSETASSNGLCNFPDDVGLALKVGKALCENLLEPLQDTFGRIAVRSAFRSAEVNQFGNDHGHNCSSNDKNFAGHIWDVKDAGGHMGATACIIVPSFWDCFQNDGDWQKLAWWIHDNLPYSDMEFYPKSKLWAFNLTWNEQPKRQIYSYADPRGYLTQSDMENHGGSNKSCWIGIEKAFK